MALPVLLVGVILFLHISRAFLKFFNTGRAFSCLICFISSKARYDAALSELKELMDKRDAIRKEEIFTAIADSKYSYEEILDFINGKLRIA